MQLKVYDIVKPLLHLVGWELIMFRSC